MAQPPCIIVHGGVQETRDCPLMVERVTSCRKAAILGYNAMVQHGGTALDAVEVALRWLEDDELFNCGYGSALNQFCEPQMDASMVDGKSGDVGSVVAISDVDHPISLARSALATRPNVLLCGEAASKLAQNLNGVLEVSKGNMVSPAAHASCVSPCADDDKEHGLPNSKETVGCVAWDGRLICAGSTTGGVNRKRPGRVGDSGLLGCGLYADGELGCSLSAHGESAIRLGLARRISRTAREVGVEDALKSCLQEMLECTGDKAGAVALTKDGEWSAYHCGAAMPYAFVRESVVCSGWDPPQPPAESEASSECIGGVPSSTPSVTCSCTSESKKCRR